MIVHWGIPIPDQMSAPLDQIPLLTKQLDVAGLIRKPNHVCHTEPTPSGCTPNGMPYFRARLPRINIGRLTSMAWQLCGIINGAETNAAKH